MTRPTKRSTAWTYLIVPLVLASVLGFSLGRCSVSALAEPPVPESYLTPSALMELIPTPEPTPAPIPEPTRTYLGTFRATAYCACERCCGKWSQYHLTASGTTPEEGRTVAADWSVLPAGTVIEIEGIGQRTVEDTGSGIDGQALDVFFESHQEALEFGVREVEVFAAK